MMVTTYKRTKICSYKANGSVGHFRPTYKTSVMLRPASSLSQAACQGSKLLPGFLQQRKRHPLSSLLISRRGKSIYQAH